MKGSEGASGQKSPCFRFYKHQSATSRSEKWGENRKLLGRTCLLCSFFHLLQFPKNDAPSQSPGDPWAHFKKWPKDSYIAALQYAQERCAEIPADSRVECCRISARMSTPFSSSKFSQISGSGILVLCKNLVGISALLRHCYAGSSETQCFASNKCEPSRAPYHCASQS